MKDVPGQVIRVGVFANPPIAFEGDNGKWQGISIDILQAIADEKKWKLEFVAAPFSELLKKSENHQIDIISMMAYSTKRAEKFIFTHTPLISNWGLIYSRANSKIGSLLDLEGKRVAVMRNNTHDKAFRELVEKFNLNVEIVELDDFSDVMESVQKKEVDAGVANRLFGAINADKYNLVETGIIFNPINIHYASQTPSHKVIIDAIDQKLSLLKADKDSIYYDALHHWMSNSQTKKFPIWLAWLALGLFSLTMLMIGATVLLRRQVASRTQELQLEVDERRQAQEQLDNLAYYDSLTNLPNRASLLENLKYSVNRAKLKNNKVAVLFIDIDNFKTINDSLGHDAGDQLIIQVAQRLKDCLRDEDTINRFGGDEFVGILQDIHSHSDINHVTDRMLASLAGPIDIGLSEVFSSVCIGIALYPDDDNTGVNILKYADAAMYHAKAQGGNNHQFYNSELTQRVQNRLSLETRIRHALDRDEFQLYYQPIINISNQQPVGVEALIRWQDPERGLIPPDDFIPLAEESGLIVPIGEWVMETACAQIKEWESQGLGQLELAVNISSRQFDNNKLYSNVMSALRNSGLNTQQLELEITERMFLNITHHVRETLDQLTRENVKLSIDDFGTGYSSLSYLKQLPINTLKIDRSFIMGIPEDKDDAQIATTIVAMAHGLRLDVVAEGIENEKQLNFLKALNCGRGQGYYLCRPKPAEEIFNWLKENMKTQ
jgi:diguanylate cyclase (GGDEF)-like protein